MTNNHFITAGRLIQIEAKREKNGWNNHEIKLDAFALGKEIGPKVNRRDYTQTARELYTSGEISHYVFNSFVEGLNSSI